MTLDNPNLIKVGASGVSNFTYTTCVMRDALVKFMVSFEMPCTLGEYANFEEFMQACQLAFSKVSIEIQLEMIFLNISAIVN